MSPTEDLKQILETVLPTDPSYRGIYKAEIDSCIGEIQQYASEGSIEAFLMSAMHLLALHQNGHTRLIPNGAISVLPLSFVSTGRLLQFMRTAQGVIVPQGKLIAMNGAALSQIEATAENFLAGTRQRKGASVRSFCVAERFGTFGFCVKRLNDRISCAGRIRADG